MNNLRSYVPVISGLSSVIERNLDLCHRDLSIMLLTNNYTCHGEYPRQV